MLAVRRPRGAAAVATAALALAVASAIILASRHASASAATGTVAVRIAGGHATDPRDKGRPVVLVAGALGVPAPVFRYAFSHVTPAAAGAEPDPAQVQRNKQALLRVLAPYGVTNASLDAASNHYRYSGSAGETWPHTAASVSATIRDGKVVAVRIVRAGSGYTSAPVLTVPGHPAARLAVKLHFGRAFSSNGSIASVRLTKRA